MPRNTGMVDDQGEVPSGSIFHFVHLNIALLILHGICMHMGHLLLLRLPNLGMNFYLGIFRKSSDNLEVMATTLTYFSMVRVLISSEIF